MRLGVITHKKGNIALWEKIFLVIFIATRIYYLYTGDLPINWLSESIILFAIFFNLFRSYGFEIFNQFNLTINDEKSEECHYNGIFSIGYSEQLDDRECLMSIDDLMQDLQETKENFLKDHPDVPSDKILIDVNDMSKKIKKVM